MIEIQKLSPVHPAHYRSNNHQLIEIIRHLPFNIGNSLKYVYRFEQKGRPAEDLRKALWYINDFLSFPNFQNFENDSVIVEKIYENSTLFISETSQQILEAYVEEDLQKMKNAAEKIEEKLSEL